MSKIPLSLNAPGRLFKIFVKDMPMLFYFCTASTIFCWSQERGWRLTYWQKFKGLRYYIEHLQRGKISLSSELEFLLETGKDLSSTFKEIKISHIISDYKMEVELKAQRNRLNT